MLHKVLKTTLFLVLLIGSQVSAQQTTFSPYSRYGLGELSYGGFSSQIAFGGLSSAFSDSNHVNFYNPASYSSLKLTTFETAANFNFVNLSDNQETEFASSAAFSYFALGFPIIKQKAAVSFGLLPYSNKGYKIDFDVTDTVVGNQSYSYDGNGGINQFFLGAGVNLAKNLSVGINGSYMFGKLETKSAVEFPDSTNIINSRFIRTTTVGDIRFSGGIIYKLQFSEKSKITFGVNGTLSNEVSAENDLLIENYVKSSSGFEYIKDTVLFEEGEKGKITLPLSFGGGVMVDIDETWMFGADFNIQNWSDFESFGVSDSLNNSLRIAAGCQYSPHIVTSGFWGKRAVYRAGFRYYKSYLELQNTAIEEYGITFGIGIPVNTTKIRGTSDKPFHSNLNLSFELGKRGTTDNSLIKEEFFNVTIGFTFRDKWFNKRKYD